MMSDCVFFKIINNEMETRILYEDETLMVIVPLHSVHPESALISLTSKES